MTGRGTRPMSAEPQEWQILPTAFLFPAEPFLVPIVALALADMNMIWLSALNGKSNYCKVNVYVCEYAELVRCLVLENSAAIGAWLTTGL